MYNRVLISKPVIKSIVNKNININMLQSADKFLMSSILLETCSTALLKNTEKNKIWFIPVYTGYAVSLYIFPKSLEKYALSSAYSIWCIGGIILTTTIDRIFFKEYLTLKKVISILVMISGILIN